MRRETLILFLLLIFAGCISAQEDQSVQQDQPDEAMLQETLSEAHRISSEAKESYERGYYTTAATRYRNAARKYREGGAYEEAAMSETYAEQALEAGREETERRQRNAAREDAARTREEARRLLETGAVAFEGKYYSTARKDLEKAAQKYRAAAQKYRYAGDYANATELEDLIAQIEETAGRAKARQSEQTSQTFAGAAEKLSKDYEAGVFSREYRWEYGGADLSNDFQPLSGIL